MDVTLHTRLELTQHFRELAYLTRRELSRLVSPRRPSQVVVKSLTYKHVDNLLFYGFIELDTRRLPAGLNHRRLVQAETLKHLTMVLGVPVYKLNSTGLTYCVVLLDRRQQAALPRNVPLDLTAIPTMPYAVPMGVTSDGPLWLPLEQVVGLLVGGNPRTGKSTYLNAVILSLLQRYSPDELRLALVDPKAVEFMLYQRFQIPHLLLPVAVDADEVRQTVARINLELNERKAAFTALGAKDLTRYNRLAPAAGNPPLPVVLLIVDEFADLMDEFGKKDDTTLKQLKRIARMGPAFGLHTIIATQRPDAVSLDTTIRAILPTRVALSVSESTASKMILGEKVETGAEQIAVGQKGRMLVKLPAGEIRPVQGYHVPEELLLSHLSEIGSVPTSNQSALSPSEKTLITWSLVQNNGYLTIRDMQEQLGLSAHQSYQQLQEWRLKGWVEKDSYNNNAHRVQPEVVRPWLDDNYPQPESSHV